MVLSEFFALRWRGQVALRTLFWRDMVVVGSLVNLIASLLALVLVAQGVPLGYAVALHFAPLPYNLFLFATVGRSPQRTSTVMALATAWLVAACLL